MVDPGRLGALIDRLKDETTHLHRLGKYPSEELEADPDRLAAIKYRFIVAIETCIDAGQHIIASEGLRVPADYADVFEVLADNGFIEQGQVSSLKEMARFRNLLVHGYQRVDEARVIEILVTRVGDFDIFRSTIAARVSSSKATEEGRETSP